MKTQIMLQFPRPAQENTLSQLARNGAEAHKDYLNTWIFPGSSVPQEFDAYLRSRQINYTQFFEFQPTSTDSSDELAGYLWLGRFESVHEEESDLILARGTDLQEVIASTELSRKLSSISTEITWSDFRDQDGFVMLNRVAQFPDPIVVPNAPFVSEGEDGVWAVQSDGRELLTQNNYELLMRAGIANPSQCTVDGRILGWRRGLVFGGRVLQYLMENEVVGMPSSPSFLAKTGTSS
jgi:hypothetical protein